MRTMKRFICALMALGGVWSAHAEMWALRLPDTGLLPSFGKATFLSRMHERHGGSHLGMQEYTLNLPFADPRKSHIGSWWYNVQGNATITLMDVGGGLDLRRDELCLFSVPVTFIKPMAGGDKFMFTVMPRYAGDTLSSAHAWDVAFVADYHVKYSETFSYSLGLAASPRFAQYGVVPFIFFSWQATPQWQVRFQGYQLAALYAVNDRLSIGPALDSEGGAWMVSTPQGQRIFRMRSLTATLLAEYNFAPAGKTKRLLVASVGSTLATTAEFCRRNGGKDSVQMRHYKPGAVVSLGVDFRF